MLFAAMTFDLERDWHGHDFNHGSSTWPYADRPNFDMVWTAVPRLLDLMDDFEIEATWFVSGEAVDECEDLLKEIISRGHEIGCHTHPFCHTEWFSGTHPNDQDADRLSNYPDHVVRLMVQKDTHKILKTLKYKPVSFRAGQLVYFERLLPIIKSLGYECDSSRRVFLRKPESIFNQTFSAYLDTDLVEVPVLINRCHKLRTLFSICSLKLLSPNFNVYFSHLIHPMVFGDKHLDTKNSLKTFTKILDIYSNNRVVLTTVQKLCHFLKNGFLSHCINTNV